MKVTVNDVAHVDPIREPSYSLVASRIQRDGAWKVAQEIREGLGEEAQAVLEVIILGFGGDAHDSHPSHLTVKAVFAIPVPGGISKVEVNHPNEYGFSLEEHLLVDYDNTPALIAKTFMKHAYNVLRSRLVRLTNDQERFAAIVAAVEKRCKTAHV